MIETMIGIGIFVAGIVIGYATGWDHGTAKGVEVGWTSAMQEVRRLIARTRGNANG